MFFYKFFCTLSISTCLFLYFQQKPKENKISREKKLILIFFLKYSRFFLFEKIQNFVFVYICICLSFFRYTVLISNIALPLYLVYIFFKNKYLFFTEIIRNKFLFIYLFMDVIVCEF